MNNARSRSFEPERFEWLEGRRASHVNEFILSSVSLTIRSHRGRFAQLETRPRNVRER